MTGRRLLVLASVTTLLPVALASGAPGGHARAAGGPGRPRIESGRYGGGDVYLDVDVRKRTASFHFTLYCDAIYSDQYVTSGPKPVSGDLTGIRRGATVKAEGEYSGPAASGPGTQLAFWSMKGKFTRATHFDGRVEYEASTSPAPPRARAQCLDSKSIHLDRQPAG